MNYAKISQVAHYAPRQVVSNDDLAEIMDTSDEWIRTRTGIRSRHIAQEGQTASALAAQAAKKAIADAGIAAEQIEALSLRLQRLITYFRVRQILSNRRLGSERAACFDLSAACTGFLYAMSVADAILKWACTKRYWLSVRK